MNRTVAALRVLETISGQQSDGDAVILWFFCLTNNVKSVNLNVVIRVLVSESKTVTCGRRYLFLGKFVEFEN
jgi:hypothetical protein